MRNLTKFKTGLSIVIFLITSNLYSQVTIGNSEGPESGAILQLKNIDNINDGGANATQGMILPRVNITSINNLFPMFEDDANGGYKEHIKSEEDNNHTGLIVYNTVAKRQATDNECINIPQGLYVWDGTRWQGIGFSSGSVERKGYLHTDLVALKKIEDDNPGAVFPWSLDLANNTIQLDETLNAAYLPGFTDGCDGNERYVHTINLYHPKVTHVDLDPFKALTAFSLRETNVSFLNIGKHKKELIGFEVSFDDTYDKTQFNINDYPKLWRLRFRGGLWPSSFSIDLSQHNLMALILLDAPITDLDLSAQTNLVQLYLERTPLENIDLSNLSELQFLGLGSSPISTIDISKSLKLNTLDISNTNITNIDISKNLELTQFGAANPKFTSIDLSNHIKLSGVDVSSDSHSIELPEKSVKICRHTVENGWSIRPEKTHPIYDIVECQE